MKPYLLRKIDDVNSLMAEKANKDEIFGMANMGQDIRETWTTGIVAVVDGESAGFNNVNLDIKNVLGAYGSIALTESAQASQATDVSILNDGIWYKGRFDNAGVYGQNSYMWYTKRSGVAGDRIKVTGQQYGTGWFIVLAFKSDNTLINKYLEGTSGAYVTYTDSVVVLPANTSYYVLQVVTNSGTNKGLKKMSISNANISNHETRISNIENYEEDTKSVIYTYAELSAWSTGVYMTGADTLIANNAYSSMRKTVTAGEAYKITLTTDTSRPSVRIYDVSLTLLQSLVTRAVDGTTVTDYEFTIPANGVILIIEHNTPANDHHAYKKGLANLSGNETRITALENNQVLPSICIGSTIYAVVGDTTQLYYKSIVDSYQDYFLAISCTKGKNYTRYWEYTPTVSDVGTTTLTLTLYNKSGIIIEAKNVNIITKQAVNPLSAKNILNVGDSLISAGQIPVELSRRLKGTTGVATSPSTLGLSNFNIVGRLKNTDSSVGWEGTGGWSFSTYYSAGNTAVRFNVTGITDLSIGATYRVDFSGGYYYMQVQEINVTSGTGNIMLMFYTTPYTSDFATKVATSGSLTKTSGSGQNTLTYTSYSVESYQPFWNNTSNSFDITTYKNTYCNGNIDYIFIQLGVNSLISKEPFDTLSDILVTCKTLIDLIHSQLPSAVILLATNILPSQNGGIGANYGADSKSGKYREYGLNHKIMEMNKLYFTLESDATYNSFVKVLNIHAQVDSDNVYPATAKAINTRVATTENVGTNGVHPADAGYWQIADAEFRSVIGLTS